MKVHLKRIKKYEPKPSQPDYESFFKGKEGKIFHVVGYLADLSSDITLTIKEADLNNPFIRKTYVDQWRGKI